MTMMPSDCGDNIASTVISSISLSLSLSLSRALAALTPRSAMARDGACIRERLVVGEIGEAKDARLSR